LVAHAHEFSVAIAEQHAGSDSQRRCAFARGTAWAIASMSELKDKVSEWLGKGGYPLEMRVAQRLQRAGFGVVQSEYYEDPESGKWRETDVIAYEHHQGKTCRAIFSLVVECKSAKDKPWVLFTATDPYPKQLSVSRRASTEVGRSVLNILSLNGELRRSALFAVPERPGYGLTIALRNNEQDAAYEALQSVCKAALGIVARHGAIATENILPFAWPVIVINAPLFESYLDSNGALQTESIEKGLLIWKNPLVSRHTIVQVYTEKAFFSEAEQYRSNVLAFLQAATAEHDRAPRVKLANNSLEGDAAEPRASG
jgi:hypothetical protein